MGPYDNESGKYILMQDVMDAHWLEHNETGALAIIAKQVDGFESHGEVEDFDEEILLAMSDEELADEETMENLGFSLIQSSLRRFSEEDGYYHA